MPDAYLFAVGAALVARRLRALFDEPPPACDSSDFFFEWRPLLMIDGGGGGGDGFEPPRRTSVITPSPYPLDKRDATFWLCWLAGGVLACVCVAMLMRCCCCARPTHRARRFDDHGLVGEWCAVELVDHTLAANDRGGGGRSSSWVSVRTPLRSRRAVNRWADACVGRMLRASGKSSAYIVVRHP